MTASDVALTFVAAVDAPLIVIIGAWTLGAWRR